MTRSDPSGSWTRRRLLGAGALGLGAGLLTACGRGSAANASMVTQWNGWTGAQGILAQRQLSAAFAKQAGGARVQQTGYPWDTLFSKLPAAAAAGNPPKVVILHTTEVPQYADLGILRPLDRLVADAGLDFAGLPANQLDACTYDASLYAVPGDQHPFALWFNTDLVERAGLDPNRPPTDREQFLAWIDELTIRRNGSVKQYGFQLPFRGSTTARWFFHTLLHQFGGAFFDAEHRRCTVDGDAGREALRLVVDLIASGKVATGGSQQDPVAAGQVAMWVAGSWELRLRVEEGLPFATATMPRIGPRPAVWANSHCLALTTEQSEDEAANSMGYAKFVYDNYAIPASTVGFIPANPRARADRRLTERPYFHHYRPFIEALDHTALEPVLVPYGRLFSFGRPTPVNDNLEAAIDRKKSVSAALADMRREVDEVLRSS